MHFPPIFDSLLTVTDVYLDIQRLCQTNAAAEIQEALNGITRRCEELGTEVPIIVTADNCCQIQSAVHKALPHADVVLDVYHFLMRYCLHFT